MRRVAVAGLATCLLALAFGFSQTAQAGWIDAKTGQAVGSMPVLADGPTLRAVPPDITDRNRAFDEKTGRNFVRDACD